MIRSLYLVLALVRAYCATVPSYIHPDEHFQGPEVIIGRLTSNTVRTLLTLAIGDILGWPTHKTWEFTSDHPIRSTFPLRVLYGPSIVILKWISEGLHREISPLAVFYVLRTLMFLMSFVLEDWALHELIPTKRDRARALILIASSYVTWTFQSHTFSNSLETILVLWCMVLVGRIRHDTSGTAVRSCAALAFLAVLGVFNRITFPAFLVLPAIELVPHLLERPWRLPIILLVAITTTFLAVAMDTEQYSGQALQVRRMFQTAVFTPWNNLMYNLDDTNLAKHGLHPFWQHFVANLPQLLGPAYPLVFLNSERGMLFWSGIIGTALLSCFRHQEARFLLPAVPLLLSSIRIPSKFTRPWVYTWIAFNILAGVLFGVYHQGGVIPVQAWIGKQPNITEVLWWKTYSPPRWLLDGKNHQVTTTDLMGMSGENMVDAITSVAACNSSTDLSLLVAPSSATFLDAYASPPRKDVSLQQLYHYRQHIGLDDLEFGDDGVWPTLQRVVGRRGLTVWGVSRAC